MWVRVAASCTNTNLFRTQCGVVEGIGHRRQDSLQNVNRFASNFVWEVFPLPRSIPPRAVKKYPFLIFSMYAIGTLIQIQMCSNKIRSMEWLFTSSQSYERTERSRIYMHSYATHLCTPSLMNLRNEAKLTSAILTPTLFWLSPGRTTFYICLAFVKAS